MFNRVILIGRLVADPELRQTPNGIPVCTFRIGVTRRFVSKDKERQSDFFDIVAWRSQAEFVSRFFSKGKPILVEGVLQSRSYEDKNGQKRYVVEVVADDLQFVESKSSSDQRSAYPPMPSAADAPPARPREDAYGDSAGYSAGSSDDFSQSPLNSDDFPF